MYLFIYLFFMQTHLYTEKSLLETQLFYQWSALFIAIHTN